MAGPEICYTPGDIADFDGPTARRLIAAGIAEAVVEVATAKAPRKERAVKRG